MPCHPGPAGRLLRLALVLVALAGCRSNLGSRTVQPARQHYSTALSHSWNEHLLLNLVRLRYRDTLQFLTVNSVVTQYSYEASGSAALGFDFEGGSDGALGGGLAYSESPTISYSPLGGEEFVKRMLSPLPPEGLMLLANSGWSIERLLMCCVSRINGLENSVSAAGPTPDYPPVFGDFKRLAWLLRHLQKANLFKTSIVEGDVFMHLLESEDPSLEQEVEEVRELLSLSGDTRVMHVDSEYDPDAPDEIAMVGRSLLAVFFYLSQGVRPPAEHEQAGLVTVTPGADGTPLDWWEAMSDILRIHASPQRPENAFVRVPYRGYWFYVEDSDLHSKSTWALLTYMFSMQASSGPGGGPLLTLSAN